MAEAERLLRLTEPQMTYLLLLFLRVTGLFALSPVLGRSNVPAMAKIGLSIAISYVFLAAYPVPASPVIDTSSLVGYLLLCVKELLVGLVIGYMTTLFFDVMVMAGQIMDVQIGFGAAQIFDPEQGLVPITGTLLNYGLLLYFFLVNGHLTLIRILYFSFQQMPVGQVAIPAAIADTVVKAFSAAVSMAVSVALPIIAAELIIEVVLGILVRSVPQLNIFVVGFSVKILAGLVALALMMPFFAAYGDRIFENLFTWIQKMLEGMVPGS